MASSPRREESAILYARPLRVASCQAPNAEYILDAVAGYLDENLPAVMGRDGFEAPKVEVVRDLTWQQRYQTLLRGETDLAWICGAPYVRRRSEGINLRLLAAPVWHAPRYLDQPVYFSDMVVRADHPARTFADLRGAHVGFNERGSYSGYESLRAELADLDELRGFFGAVTEAGSHQEALRLILSGALETAAIDSTVLEEEVRRQPDLSMQIRIVHTLGPAPMPPWVASPHLDDRVASAVQLLLLGMETQPQGRRVLAQTPVVRFAAVDDGAYDTLRLRLAAADRVTL
ncbi:MAG: phosphate/phosphite/phosphonate ABC transporter substrate-binding protein [Caldilineaceae bacterium]